MVDSSDYYQTDPQMSVFAGLMPFARPRGPSPNWPEISTAIQDMIQAVGTGVSTPEEAAAEAARKVSEIDE